MLTIPKSTQITVCSVQYPPAGTTEEPLMPRTKSQNLRQSFLAFPTVPRPQPCVVTGPQVAPRPAPELPTEVWCLILLPLSTIALKNFRLVCQEWARIGTSWLFQTVYLDSYDASWTRLQQLAESEHAHLATKIVWHPLVLHKECLDAKSWRAEYFTLLQGLNHSRSVYLHDIYCRIYHKVQKAGPARTRAVEEVSKRDIPALASLKNCREIIFQDDFDLTTCCQDPYLRKRIQNDDELLSKPATWGRHPRYLSPPPVALLASARP